MTSRTLIAVVAVAASATAGHAQRDTLTGPPDYIVEITENWGRRDSRFGDLRTKRMEPDDIELRFWGGYGLVGTRGIVLRRTSGRWSASRVAVRGVRSSDTLATTAVQPRVNLDHIWQELTDAGVMTLPPYVKRSWAMLDGHTYVTQLRIGQDYRVSRIEHVEPPEVQADRIVQQINAILTREIGWGN